VLPTRAVAIQPEFRALYPIQIRMKSERCSDANHIAAAWARVGDARRPAALIPRK